MKRLLVIIVLLCLSLTAIQAQNPGDKAAAGYTYNRAGLNPDIGNFKPPFKLEDTVDLPVVQEAPAGPRQRRKRIPEWSTLPRMQMTSYY